MGCEFRCGYRINTSRKAIELHEARCFCNPARRACKTCVHSYYEDYEHDTGAGGNFGCDVDALPCGKTATVDCDGWVIK